MQQTTKYQLNLMETSDAFSPAPLNENAQKLESALDAARAEAAASVSAETASRAASEAALDQRVQVLEARKIVVGYTPGGDIMNLGFTPRAVLVQGIGPSGGFVLALPDHGIAGVQIVEGGFRHSSYFSECNYLAIL